MKFVAIQNHFFNIDNIEDVFYLFIHETNSKNYYLRTRSGETIKISHYDFKKLVSILGVI